jgi:hypothetical protein
MFEKDYIMRMIQQMIRVLLKLFGLREQGSFEEAYDLIDLTLQQFTGLSSKMIDDFDEESLLAFLSPGGNLNLERCFVVGVLLKEEGDILFRQNYSKEGLVRYKKSFALLEKVKNTSYAEMLPQMDKIYKELEEKLSTILPKS